MTRLVALLTRPACTLGPMNTRTEIETRHCAKCSRVTPHEVHYLIERSPRGVSRQEIGNGCTRCQDGEN